MSNIPDGPKFKPCPFCGEELPGLTTSVVTLELEPDGVLYGRVTCPNCQATLREYFSDEAEHRARQSFNGTWIIPSAVVGEATVAIETAWNRRAAAPAKKGGAK